MADKYLVEGYEFDTLEMANEAKKELEAVKFMSMKTSGCSPEMALKVYSKIVDNNLFKTEIGFDYLRALEEYLMANGMFDIEKGIDAKNEETQDEKASKDNSIEEHKEDDSKDLAELVGQEEKPQKKTLFTKNKEKKDGNDKEKHEKPKKEKQVKEKVKKEKPVKEKVKKEKPIKEKPVKEKTSNNSKGLKLSIAINVILIIVVIIMFYIASTSSNPTIINYENAIIDKYSSWDEELKDKDKELKAKERELNNRENEIKIKEEELGIK